jgi:hypothetical protein
MESAQLTGVKHRDAVINLFQQALEQSSMIAVRIEELLAKKHGPVSKGYGIQAKELLEAIGN